MIVYCCTCSVGYAYVVQQKSLSGSAVYFQKSIIGCSLKFVYYVFRSCIVDGDIIPVDCDVAIIITGYCGLVSGMICDGNLSCEYCVDYVVVRIGISGAWIGVRAGSVVISICDCKYI